MTTVIKITNIGPEPLTLMYYGEDRQFLPKSDVVKVGETIEVTVWDGNVPVLLARPAPRRDRPASFYATPPATMRHPYNR